MVRVSWGRAQRVFECKRQKSGSWEKMKRPQFFGLGNNTNEQCVKNNTNEQDVRKTPMSVMKLACRYAAVDGPCGPMGTSPT